LFFFRLGERGLHSSHEARAAQNGQSILLHDDWLLPQLFDRQVELQKPPLYYWLVALFGRLNGDRVDAWCVRLPAACSALGCVLLLYELCRRRGRPLAGLLAAGVLATCVHFTWLARVGRIDMPLTFTTALVVSSFYLGHCSQRERAGRGAWPWYLLGYVGLGLGLLLKGPIAVVLPGMVLAAALLCQWWRNERRLRTEVRRISGFGFRISDFGFRSLCWGLPLVVAIALPWFWLVNAHTRGDLFRVFFWYHNFARGFGGEEALVERPWWFYGARLAIDLLPWSPLLLVAAWLWLRRREPLAGFGLLWLAAMTLLLSCLRFKRPDYLLPAFPGAALFLGCTLEDWWRRLPIRLPWRRLIPATFALLIVACLMGWTDFVIRQVPADELHRPGARFAQLVRQQTSGMVLLFRVEDHEITFHLGPPVTTLLEWENLDRWLAQSPGVYVLMPATEAEECARHLGNHRLQPVFATEDLVTDVPRPLVLMRTVP
jgi:4-amino-4-deoxy-L-arabinose transferase-like glycosyltransferase